uniref:F-box protein AUF1-like n=1 Tax=Erigeron canadensis TaxID=72917 RepID=UPI001CB9CE0A|nr:F-box protein AUF1-like [Erigeron canadensis]
MVIHQLICNLFFSDVSYYSYLPDEIVLLILNKIVDLKTLCRCKLVSKQFNLIVHQVDTISFIASRADNPTSYDSDPSAADDARNPKKLLHFLSKPFCRPAASYECESFRSAIESLSKFTRLKSLCIELPSTRQDVVDNGSDLYKWKVKFGRKIKSFVFLSPNSVCDMKGLSNVNENGLEAEHFGIDLWLKKVQWAVDCLRDAVVRFRMLLGCAHDFPLLEKVLITQSGKRGSVSISGKDIVEMRKWLHSPTDCLEQKLISDSMDLPSRLCQSYAPLLKLPVSGYVMKGVTLSFYHKKDDIDDHCFMNIYLDDFEDKEEAA